MCVQQRNEQRIRLDNKTLLPKTHNQDCDDPTGFVVDRER